MPRLEMIVSLSGPRQKLETAPSDYRSERGHQVRDTETDKPYIPTSGLGYLEWQHSEPIRSVDHAIL